MDHKLIQFISLLLLVLRILAVASLASELLPSLVTTTASSTVESSQLASSTHHASSTELSSVSLIVSSSSIVISSGSSKSTIVSKSTSTKSMPSFSSTASSSSSSSSSTSYTFEASIPSADIKNPYISNSNATNGTVFISVGAALGALFLGFFGFLSLSILIPRMRQSSDTNDLFEDYEEKNFPYDPSIFGNVRSHDGSAFLDFDSKSILKAGVTSISSSSGESSNGSSSVLLLSEPFGMNTPQQQQGRSLRNALWHGNGSQLALFNGATASAMTSNNNNNNNRKSRVLSMYISPLEQAMNQSQLGLQPPASSFDPSHSSLSNWGIGTPTSLSGVSFPSSTPRDVSPLLPVEDMRTHTRRLSGMDMYDILGQDPTVEKKKIRPPSMYLNELMDASVDDQIDLTKNPKGDDNSV